MAKFNYTDLHFFDKHGIELPVSLQTNYTVEIQNEYGDNAAFYGLKDCSTNEITFFKRKSGNRFTNKTREDCIVSINGVSYKTYANVEKEPVLSSNEDEYCVKDITSVYLDEDLENIINSLEFPTITLSTSITFSRISVDLVETQSIYVLAEGKDDNHNNIFMKMQDYELDDADVIEWKNRYKLLFYIDNKRQQDFRFFNVDNSELKWTDKVLFDFNNNDFKLNIGFCAKEEGVYEETAYICLLENYDQSDQSSGNIYPIGAIHLQAEAIGEDERYRTLFQNFGIPDPIHYQEVFANTSLEEGKMDYMKLNENSKKLFLTYSEIFSYLGTYKALINAVNLLGYTDIFFKEWYKEIGKTISTQGYITYDMTYHSDSNANIINNIPIEERISLKKLNWISMVYRINKELSDLPEDQWGFPQLKDVYDYNNEEIIVKLYSLKKWLEKYIIGLNCKIVDISGEGIYFERYKLDTYGTFQQVYDWNNAKNLIPYIPTITLEDGDILDYTLVDSSVDIHVNVGLDKAGTLEDYKNYKINEFIDGFIDLNNKYHQRIPEEDDISLINVGRTFDCLNEFESYEIKATSYGEDFLFGPEYLSEDSPGLRVSNNRIFFNPFDLLTKEKQSAFTLLPFIQIEKANIRKMESNWNNSVKYRINPILTDDSKESYVIKNIETGSTFTTTDYIMLLPPSSYEDCSTYTEITSFSGNVIQADLEYVPVFTSDNPDTGESIYSKTINHRTYGLRYSAHNIMDIPMFSIIGYEVDGISDFIDNNEYFLEILDGKMLFNDEQHNRKLILNFNYDEETGEQEVKINMIYVSDEFNIIRYHDNEAIANFIPGNAYQKFVENYSSNPDEAISYIITHAINVQNTGKFLIDVFAKDIHNNIFAKNCENDVYVHLPNFSITTYTNTENSNNEFNKEGDSLYNINSLTQNYYDFCIYNNAYMIEGFSKSIMDDEQRLTVNYPNYSYSLHRAIEGDYLHFMNISDKYFIDALDYEYNATNDKTYTGYSFILERLGANKITRVIEEYDSAALLSIKNEYISSNDTTALSYIDNLCNNSNSDLDFIDINLILYNELGNYPVLQTYAAMINENAIPYAPGYKNLYYNNNKYRAFIGEYSETSYIWASLRENIEQKIKYYVIDNLNLQLSLDIEYIPDVIDPTNTETTPFTYLDLAIDEETFMPVAEDFVQELIDSSYNLPCSYIPDDDVKEIMSDLKESLEHIINSYNSDEIKACDTSTEMRNLIKSFISDMSYNISNMQDDLYIKVRTCICQNNQETLDPFVKEYILKCLDENCKIENILSQSDLYAPDSSTSIAVYNILQDDTKPAGNSIKNAELDETVIYPIVTAITNSLKVYGNDINKIYQYFVLTFFENNYIEIIDKVNTVFSSGAFKKLHESTADNVRDNVLEVMLDALNDINSDEYEQTISSYEVFDSLYTRFLFAACCYIGFSVIQYVISDNTFVDSLYNNLYSIYLEKTRDDVLIESFKHTIRMAKGLYYIMFNLTDIEETDENTIYNAIVENYTVTGVDEYQIYEKIIHNLVESTQKSIRDTWVTKSIDDGDYLYAVASVYYDGSEEEKEGEEEEDEETVPQIDPDDYSSSDTIPSGTLYYVKPEENPNEGLKFVQTKKNTAISPNNVLPDIKELIKKPYISAYVQPTWKAQINISLITKEDAIRLGFEDIENLDYLCIQYANSDFTWHFRKGEMVKLIFESLTNNEYVGQSSYEVIGYDTENQVVIVKGTINNAYIRGEKHEVWAQILDDHGVGTEMLDTLNTMYSDGKDRAESECEPFTKEYIYDIDGIESKTSYRLPVKRLNGIWYYKVFYFVNGIPRAIETQKIDPQEKVNMYISYAHNAFVDYIMKAKSSTEKSDGTTDLEIDYTNLNCRKMEFIDDTFVMYSKDFDVNEGLAAWMNSNDNIPAIVDQPIYSYTSENGFVPVNISKQQPNIVFAVNFEDLGIDEKESYVQWKIYRTIPTDNSRKYMFESYNKVLYLDYTENGIYDIEANVYDKYGNTVTKLFKGAYKVTN